MKKDGCRRAAVCLSILLLASCAKSVPPEKAAYVGEWRGPGMMLIITPEGNVAYERENGSMNTNVIDAPLKGFSGNDFEVGIGFFTTTFTVSQPPHEEDGVWKMVVDEVELTRIR